MIGNLSSREYLKKSEIKKKLKEYFEKCAAGRHQLRKCVVNAMDAGLTKENILEVVNKIATGTLYDETSLCAIVAIGQALRYEEKNKKIKPVIKTGKDRKEIEDKLKICFKKCGLARRQLRKYIVNVLDAGLTKEEVLGLSDDIVGGFGKEGVSLCAIVAVTQVLEYEESVRTKPIDILNERSIEREDT